MNAPKPLTLPADLAARMRERVESGTASDPAEVIRAGLDALAS